MIRFFVVHNIGHTQYHVAGPFISYDDCLSWCDVNTYDLSDCPAEFTKQTSGHYKSLKRVVRLTGNTSTWLGNERDRDNDDCKVLPFKST